MAWYYDRGVGCMGVTLKESTRVDSGEQMI